MTIPAALLMVLLAGAPASASAPAVVPPSGDGRDPFLGPGAAESDPKLGLRGMSWQHLRCTGVVTGPGGPVVTLDAGERGTFLAREGDRLRNAVVAKIDLERRGVLLKEPVSGTVAGYREVILLVGQEQAIVREPRSPDPALSAKP